MVANAHISWWRRVARRESPSADVVPPGTVAASALAETDAAWQLCSTLPQRQRAAVVLRFDEDLSYAEIAEVLLCSEGTARSQVHRALASLRTRLENDEQP
jgi:RNA polymerase sigma factor (sigma-70 family)